MALTPSNMLPLGTTAPNFYLKDVISDQWVSLPQLNAKQGLLVLFICNHCPYVKHIVAELASFANECVVNGLAVVAISSNDIEQYSDDAPEFMSVLAEKYNFKFPYCFDETQSIARSYDAACTPDLYLFDSALHLVYRGQFDDARPGQKTPITGKDLKQAVSALLAGRPIDPSQKPSMGCNIKWKAHVSA